MQIEAVEGQVQTLSDDVVPRVGQAETDIAQLRVSQGNYLPLAGGTLTGSLLAPGQTIGTPLKPTGGVVTSSLQVNNVQAIAQTDIDFNSTTLRNLGPPDLGDDTCAVRARDLDVALSNYLPLAGGELSGAITQSNYEAVRVLFTTSADSNSSDR